MVNPGHNNITSAYDKNTGIIRLYVNNIYIGSTDTHNISGYSGKAEKITYLGLYGEKLSGGAYKGDMTIFGFNGLSDDMFELRGDVDDSGKLTATDAAYIFKKANDGEFTLPTEEKENFMKIADVNGDGQITKEDAEEILLKVREADHKFSGQ